MKHNRDLKVLWGLKKTPGLQNIFLGVLSTASCQITMGYVPRFAYKFFARYYPWLKRPRQFKFLSKADQKSLNGIPSLLERYQERQKAKEAEYPISPIGKWWESTTEATGKLSLKDLEAFRP